MSLSYDTIKDDNNDTRVAGGNKEASVVRKGDRPGRCTSHKTEVIRDQSAQAGYNCSQLACDSVGSHFSSGVRAATLVQKQKRYRSKYQVQVGKKCRAAIQRPQLLCRSSKASRRGNCCRPPWMRGHRRIVLIRECQATGPGRIARVFRQRQWAKQLALCAPRCSMEPAFLPS